MKKYVLLPVCLLLMTTFLHAQEEEEKERGFKKEKLFTGGSISLAFYSNTFLVGASPVFGYNLTNWIDAGIVVNYNYSAYRDVYTFDDRLKQQVYGGGGFLKIYPLPFIFAQAQFEHNFLRQKYTLPNGGGTSQTLKEEANSILVGGGYCTGRRPGSGMPFFYLSILFDVGDNVYSPYTDAYGRTIPIIQAGMQIPLFQGR